MKLSTELVSLIHHIELNKIGWWDVAVQRLILAAIWTSKKHLTLSEILGVIDGDFQVSVDTAKTERQVKCLCQSGALQVMPGSRFKIAERSLKALESDIEESTDVQNRVRDKFADSLRRCCPVLDPDETWQEVNDHLFIPSIRAMGSRFYSFVSGDSLGIDQLAGLQDFLSRYSDDVAASLRNTIMDFMSQGDSDIRSYVLCYLQAFFFAEAGNLSDSTIEALSKSMTRPPSFRIFADANFIFSALGIHTNPSDEDAQTALELVKRLAGTVKIQLYVLPPTLEETRQAIQWRVDEYRRLELTPNLAVSSLQRPELGGFIRKLAEEAKNSGQPLSVEDYYGPYVTNLLQIVRAKGIELYNTDVSEYTMRQAVIDDMETQLAYEEERQRHGARKKSL